MCTLNTAQLPKNDTLFFRYYVNDNDHANDTEFPTDGLIMPYKTLWSFIVTP